MKIEIRRLDNGDVIVGGDYEDIRDCLKRNKTANLAWANLTGANLARANLTGADLTGANLWWANLTGADLTQIQIAPHVFLMAEWGNVSDALCVDLMRYDAANHPDPEKFMEWAEDGACPYSETAILRSANFNEKRKLIKPDFLSRPVKSAYELMQELIREKGKQ